jgi:hypothetical protein
LRFYTLGEGVRSEVLSGREWGVLQTVQLDWDNGRDWVFDQEGGGQHCFVINKSERNLHVQIIIAWCPRVLRGFEMFRRVGNLCVLVVGMCGSRRSS